MTHDSAHQINLAVGCPLVSSGNERGRTQGAQASVPARSVGRRPTKVVRVACAEATPNHDPAALTKIDDGLHLMTNIM